MKTAIIRYCMILAAGAMAITARAQSVKDIIGDTSGAYIYAQALDENEQDALELAVDELKSRVVTYLGSNKKQEYNHNWQEWVKRIITSKYGRTRVFVYLSVSDLDPKADESPAAPKQEAAEPKPKPKAPEPKPAPKAETKPSAAPEAKVEPVQAAAQDSPQAAAALPGGALGNLISNIQTSAPGDVLNLLAKAKNMQIVSRYDNVPGKYMSHAYLIVWSGGAAHVYSPIGKDGMRTDFNDGRSVREPEGRLLYWFLKK